MKHSVLSLLLLLFPSVLSAQETDFFWSLHELNSGAVNGPLSVSAQTGDTLSLYLYYTTQGPSNQDLNIGALLDLAPSREGVIRFTSAETFDYPITVQDIKIGNRWGSTTKCSDSFGELGTVTDFRINEWGAFTLFGEGIRDFNAGNPILDEGYDLAADAFLFGRVNFEVIGGSGQAVKIHVGRGNGGIVGRSVGTFDEDFFEPVFGSVVVSVGDFLLGDVNNDGEVNLLDIAPFVQTILVSQFCAASDVNCDGVVDLRDVESFVSLIAGGNLPVVDPSAEDTEPQQDLLGDMNSDGFINLLDIPCFLDLHVDCPNILTGDINMDGSVDLLDACPFVDLLLAID